MPHYIFKRVKVPAEFTDTQTVAFISAELQIPTFVLNLQTALLIFSFNFCFLSAFIAWLKWSVDS